jgi:hypothetical protein
MAYQCCYCRREMVRSKGRGNKNYGGERRASKDHVLPSEWGGDTVPDNLRRCCQACNQLRAAVGHCVGAMACVMHIAKVDRIDPNFIARRWNMHRIASLITAPRRQPRRVQLAFGPTTPAL